MKKSAVLQHVAALVLVGAALTVAVVATAAPPVPDAIGHQGRLYNSDNTPVTGDRQMTFAIFETPNPGMGDAPIWSESQAVTFDDGYYAAAMGATAPLLDANGQKVLRRPALYLQISIDGEALRPLAKLNSVPYALVCDDATGDIHPTSVSIGDAPVINASGEWVGSPTNLVGPQGPSGVVASVSAWGQGSNPTNVLGFLSPVATVSVDGTQDVLVTGQKALGSTLAGGGTNLSLNVCSQSTSGGALTQVDGTGIVGVRVAGGTRVIQSLTARIAGLAMGDYYVGLCGSSTTFSSWNDNSTGSTTAIVVQGP